MATSKHVLEPFEIKSESVKGLDERREKGRGCYGAVYEVRVNGLPCIAKRLHDILVGRGYHEAVREEDAKALVIRFREECRLLSSLRHPNVVQFMGVHFGRDEADISLIMEYMHMDLEHCMKTYPNIPLPYKTSILRDVAYGLAYLHSLNIVHRDLNTGNILLTESLRAKVADLGVAKLFNKEIAMSRTSTTCPGAHDFMPPESLEESPKYSAKLDVFSFGHLTVYLVNQKAPLVNPSQMSVEDFQKKQVQVGMRRRAVDQMGGSRHPLYTIAVQCLGDTPAQRPTSRELVKSMEEICKQHSISYENTLDVLTGKKELETELRTALSTKDEQIAELRKTLTETLTRKDSELVELRQELTAKDRQITEQRELLKLHVATKENNLTQSLKTNGKLTQQVTYYSNILGKHRKFR